MLRHCINQTRRTSESPQTYHNRPIGPGETTCHSTLSHSCLVTSGPVRRKVQRICADRYSARYVPGVRRNEHRPSCTESVIAGQL